MADALGGNEFGGFTKNSLELGTFDIAAFVQLDENLLPTGVLCLQRDSITHVAKARGGKLVCFWSDVARHPGRIDIGAAVSEAALGLRPGQESRVRLEP